MSGKNNTTIVAAGLAALITFLVYLRSVGCDFVYYDDYHYIVENPAIRILDWQFIREAFQTFYMGVWMPLSWISLAVDYYLWGLNPAGYHLTNILLHSLNTGLVVLIADKLLKRSESKPTPLAPPLSGGKCFAPPLTRGGWEGLLYPATLLFAGLAWGIHPLRVESVAWASERKDVLNGLFSLGSIFFYLRYVSDLNTLRDKKGYLLQYFISIVFFVFSLMAKPVSVVIPAMLLLIDWFPLHRFSKGNLGRIFIEKIPFLTLSAIVSVGTILGTASGGAALVSYQVLPFLKRVLLSGNALFEYCRMALYPVNVTFLYIMPHTFPVSYLVHTLVVALFTCFILFVSKKKPWVLATWALFIIPLIPTLGFFQISLEAYSLHYTYLALVAPSIAAAGGINFVYEKYSSISLGLTRSLIIGFSTSLLLFYGITTFALIGSWQNSETLCTRQISIQPVGRAYEMRGGYYLLNKRYFEAEGDLQKAIKIANDIGFPRIYNLYAMRGVALGKIGRYEEAQRELSEAIKLNPQPNYYYHRGLALKALGKSKEAEDDFIIAGNDTGALRGVR